MIKAIARTKDGRHVVIVGLSEMNLVRLRQGKPIHMFGAEIGLKEDIIIMWGPTEEAMAADLIRMGGTRVDPIKES